MEVTNLSGGVAAISPGSGHTCALTTDGGVLCWGENWTGQLGDGTTGGSAIPVEVTSLSSGVAVISSGGSHTCALTAIGGVRCWGYNHDGQLGNGTTGEPSNTPGEVTNLSSGVAAIAAGWDYTCALTTGGGVLCWGDNRYGQLGNGTAGGSSSTPVAVTNLSSGVAAISAGGYHACALTTDGGVLCWGSNGSGQLGDDTTDRSSDTPVKVTNLSSGVDAISANYQHTCALMTGGGVRCWGSNGFGRLGNGASSGSSSTPVGVTGLSGVNAISAGGYHTCALTTDGGVWCWGTNVWGQLGNGTRFESYYPAPVLRTDLSSGVEAIAAGYLHTCALTTDGGVWCWGDNDGGQLGNGMTGSSSTPVEATNLSM